jgi:snurportin-1
MTLSISEPNGQTQYIFPYPTTFLPIPYHTDTTLSMLLNKIIPFSRSVRAVTVDIPTYPRVSTTIEASMDIDSPHGLAKKSAASIPVSVNVAPDGLLLYVAEASYEAGSSPLSSWIPITRDAENHAAANNLLPVAPDSPLDLFQR